MELDGRGLEEEGTILFVELILDVLSVDDAPELVLVEELLDAVLGRDSKLSSILRPKCQQTEHGKEQNLRTSKPCNLTAPDCSTHPFDHSAGRRCAGHCQ